MIFRLRAYANGATLSAHTATHTNAATLESTSMNADGCGPDEFAPTACPLCGTADTLAPREQSGENGAHA